MKSNRNFGNMASNFLDSHNGIVNQTKYALISKSISLNDMSTKFYGKKTTKSSLGNMNRHMDVQLTFDNLPEETIVRKPIIKNLVVPSNNLINIKSYENPNLNNNATDFTKLNLSKIYIIVNNHVLNEGYIYKTFFESNNIISEVVNLNGEIISDSIYRDVLDNNDKILLLFGVTTISNPRILYNLKHKCLIYQIEQKNILSASDLYVLKDFLKEMPNIIEFSHNNNFHSKNIDLKLPLIQSQTNNTQKDIDILFYGSLSTRRKNILKQLYQFKKYKIKYVYDTYGNELLNLINRSKIVLNLHTQNDSFFEIFRINLALSYNTHIISENPIHKNEKYLYDLYKKLVFFIPQLDPYDNNNYNNLSKLIDKLLITNSINLGDKTDKINIINNISQKVLFENLNIMDSTINNLRKSNLDETLFHKYYLKLETTDNQIKYNIIKTNISDYFIECKYYAHLHCYDISKFNEIYGEYIDIICRYFSIIVTYSIGNNTIDNNSDLVILKIPNKGMDIGGKFCAVKYLNDNNISYEYILFLHSKSNPDTRKKYFKPLIDNLDDEFIKNINENDGYFPDIQWEIVGDRLKWVSNNPEFKNHENTNWPERNLLYRNEILKYLQATNNTNKFIEGNCYILSKKVINKLYTDPLIYNILNTETSFDYNWVSKSYNIKGNIFEVYKQFKERKLAPRNQKSYDGYLEHVFERVVLNFCDNYKCLKLYNKINILIRNTYRPTYFKKCIDSILNQDYENYKVIMCYDDDYCLEYLEQYKNNPKIEIFKATEVDKSHQAFYNLYCNQLLDKVPDGWIMFLDDDDMFSNYNVLNNINHYLANANNLVFWKFKRPDRLIYPDIKLLKRDTIASCGYCFHSKYKDLSQWTAWQGGDYDYINGLIQKNNFNKYFIDDVLTQTTFGEMKIGNFGQKEPYPKKKYSIIMAYFNRKEQTILTFNQFERLYGNKYDFEVVIVDDCSEEHEKLNNIINNYSFEIKYIELKNKTWINSVIPFNNAINNISSDSNIIIFQHPEIYHTNNIFDYIEYNLNDSNYLTFPVYSSPSFYHNKIISTLDLQSNNFIEDFVNKIDLTEFKFDYNYYTSKYNDIKDLNYIEAKNHYFNIGVHEKRSCNKYNSLVEDKVIYEFKGWFNHHIHRPCNYNFLSAITINNLKKIGGFNNDMQNGMWYEDDEILSRIKRICNVKIVDNINYMAIHLFHNNGSSQNVLNKNSSKLIQKNYLIFKDTIRNNKVYCSPIVNTEYINSNNLIKKNDISYIENCNCVFCSTKKSNKKFYNYTILNNNTNKTLVYYDYGYGLWNSKISICYETKKLISNSNHFIDLKLQDHNLHQEIGNIQTKAHKIYSRIQNNYNLLLTQQHVETIYDKCIFLNNSFTGANAGHDLYYTLDIITKFINSNIKFIMYNETKHTNIFKIINLIIPSNRLIFINEKKVYLFENEIFDYEHNYYNSANYSSIINILNSKIKTKIEQYKIPYELHNKNIIVLKNNILNKQIIRNEDTFIIDKALINYILTKNWYILQVESSDYFYLNCYLLNHAKNIITCQRGISAFNQIFYNKNANFNVLLPSFDNIIHINKLQEVKTNSGSNHDVCGLETCDYICNNIYYNLIDNIIKLPIILNNNIISKVFNKINNSGKSQQKQNIYIYNLVELDFICSTFPILQPEQDIFDHFFIQIKNNYNIVSNIEDADIAFIPIDFVKLIYISPHHYYSIVPEGCPNRPPGTGKIHKEITIKYFWDNYVKNVLYNTSSIPHFIFYSYILFDIDFNYINKNITIFSYENVISMYKLNQPLKTENKLQTIPYILNENKQFNQSKITTYNSQLSKNYDIGFFGSLDNTHLFSVNHSDLPSRPVLLFYRDFINYIEFDNKITFIKDIGSNASKYLPNLKYLFVLRGDTVTRLAFYQCFAYNIVPIIFEAEREVYGNLLCPGINILNSCLILPNIDDKLPQDYAIIAKEIIEKELSDDNNYFEKIKNHKEIFDNFNWFKEPLSKPVENIINYISNN
tara:strand:- start:17834 stop:23827 length:5994 start_codon:yes stop_codon:yes gene_type:complete